MDSGLVPPELSGSTQCEEVLIARAFPVMQVYVIMYMQEKDIIQFHPKDIHWPQLTMLKMLQLSYQNVSRIFL